MDLKEFICESIVQICQGLSEAQEQTKDLHAVVNVPVETGSSDNLVISAREYRRTPQLIDFDVCVAVEKSGTTDIKGKLSIFSFNMSGKTSKEKSDTETSRIKFSVPMLFPTDFKFYYHDMEYREKASKAMNFKST